MNKLIQKIIFSVVLLSVTTLMVSCEKNLEVAAEKNPALGLSPATAIKNASDLQNLLNSCYDNCANMMNGRFQVVADLLGDDIASPTNNDPFKTAIYKHNIDQFNSVVGDVFSQPYYTIYRANTMDLYYSSVSDLTNSERDRMQGEAMFLRALSHFELVKIFAQPYG
jgi:starch-binding outer membrane protein, SusD/RagB family